MPTEDGTIYGEDYVNKLEKGLSAPTAEKALGDGPFKEGLAIASPEMRDTPLEDKQQGSGYAAQTFADMFEQIAKDGDKNRVFIMTGLINLFNEAIIRQAGRKLWSPDDTERFVYAMKELDGIGRAATNIRLEDYQPKR